jgi:hypothetical protein
VRGQLFITNYNKKKPENPLVVADMHFEKAG